MIKVDFEEIKWQKGHGNGRDGREKASESPTKLIRLLEFSPKWNEKTWCESRPRRICLEGKIVPKSWKGRHTTIAQGQAFVIERGEKHKAFCKSKTTVFLVGDERTTNHRRQFLGLRLQSLDILRKLLFRSVFTWDKCNRPSLLPTTSIRFCSTSFSLRQYTDTVQTKWFTETREKLGRNSMKEQCGSASGLRDSAAISRGAKVAVLDFDTSNYLEAYYAVPSIQAVLHTVNIRLPPEQIVYTMAHAEDEAVLVRDEFLPLFAKLAPNVKSLKKVVVMSDSGSMPAGAPWGSYFYDDLLNDSDQSTSSPGEFDENTPATLFYTSGTTGMPKGVWFTHRQLVSAHAFCHGCSKFV